MSLAVPGDVAGRFGAVWDRIDAAASRARRDEITLVAASKGQSAEDMLHYYRYCDAHGRRCVFGESYVQEWLGKRDALEREGAGAAEIHLIGTLQRNKAGAALREFSTIHAVDSGRLLAELAKVRAASPGAASRGVFLQINISADEAKHGFSVADAANAVREARAAPGLALRGLMTITRAYDRAEDARGDYRALAELARELEPLAGSRLELSMGMSQDYEVAIEEGATHVRVGTALFGMRA